MAAKGDFKRRCVHGHDRTLPNALYKGGGCKKCASERSKEYVRSNYLHSRYRISIDVYGQIFAEQDGKCATCGQSAGIERIRKLFIDHDHETGKIRGLLCHNCNTALGHLKDDLIVMHNMTEYLKKAMV